MPPRRRRAAKPSEREDARAPTRASRWPRRPWRRAAPGRARRRRPNRGMRSASSASRTVRGSDMTPSSYPARRAAAKVSSVTCRPGFPHGYATARTGSPRRSSSASRAHLEVLLGVGARQPREVAVAPGVRADRHPGAAQLADVAPGQRTQPFARSEPYLGEMRHHLLVAREEACGDEERRGHAASRQERQGVGVGVRVAVVERDRDLRGPRLAGGRRRARQGDHLGVLLQPREMRVEELG